VEEKERNYYQSLHEIAAEVNSAHTAGSVLHYIVKKATKAMGVKGCSLLILKPDRQRLFRMASYGLSEKYVREGPTSVDKSISEALDEWPVVVEDATNDERIRYREQVKEEGIVSILSLPVMIRDEAVGLIRLYTAEPRRFSEADINFVTSITNLGAIALQSAILYEAAQIDYETFRQALSEWRPAL